jgi:hypothetical protein
LVNCVRIFLKPFDTSGVVVTLSLHSLRQTNTLVKKKHTPRAARLGAHQTSAISLVFMWDLDRYRYSDSIHHRIASEAYWYANIEYEHQKKTLNP